MLHGAHRIATVNLPIHIYYGAVSQSMINTVGPGFYRKYLPLEEYRAAWLRQHAMYEDYCHLRADAFLNGWLVNKYNRFVAPEVRPDCRPVLEAICALYTADLQPVDPTDPLSDVTIVVRQPREPDLSDYRVDAVSGTATSKDAS